MPTASSNLGYSITNWGPLPTDFALPASCLSTTTWGIAWSDLPEAPIWVDCNPNTEALCAPTPTDSGALETAIAINDIPGDGLIGPYYSPGVACPADWTTVGVAVRGESTVSRSGIVAATTGLEDEDSGAVPTFYNNHDVLIDLLDVGETAVWCCPESATAYPGGGVCLSALSDYSFSTGCRNYYTASDVATYTTGIPGNDGQTTEGELLIITATTTATVETTTFASSEATDFIAYSQLALIRFVHKPSDLAESENGDDEGEDEEGDSGADPSETNAAGRIGATGAGGVWGGMVGSLLASLVAGAALVLVR